MPHGPSSGSKVAMSWRNCNWLLVTAEEKLGSGDICIYIYMYLNMGTHTYVYIYIYVAETFWVYFRSSRHNRIVYASVQYEILDDLFHQSSEFHTYPLDPLPLFEKVQKNNQIGVNYTPVTQSRSEGTYLDPYRAPIYKV